MKAAPLSALWTVSCKIIITIIIFAFFFLSTFSHKSFSTPVFLYVTAHGCHPLVGLCSAEKCHENLLIFSLWSLCVVSNLRAQYCSCGIPHASHGATDNGFIHHGISGITVSVVRCEPCAPLAAGAIIEDSCNFDVMWHSEYQGPLLLMA